MYAVRVYSCCFWVFFLEMLANIIFAVCFVVYGVAGKPPSKENVNNPESAKLDTYFAYL